MNKGNFVFPNRNFAETKDCNAWVTETTSSSFAYFTPSFVGNIQSGHTMTLCILRTVPVHMTWRPIRIFRAPLAMTVK